MTEPPEDSQRGTDSPAPSDSESLDALASDALEAEITGRSASDADERVSGRADQMGSVRDLLADDSDAPTDAALEELLAKALDVTGDPDHSPRDEPDLGAVPVPVRSRTASRRRRWTAVAAAAAVVVLLGAVGLAGLDSTSEDSASGVAAEATGSEGEADAGAAATPDDFSVEPTEEAGGPADRDTAESGPDEGTSSGPSQADEGVVPEVSAEGVPVLPEDSRAPLSPAGLEFTIVVPIDPR